MNNQNQNSSGQNFNAGMNQQNQDGQRGFNQNPYIQQSQNMGGMNQGGARMSQSYNSDGMQNPYYNTNNQMTTNKSSSLYGDFDTSNFIKGALIGAVGAYLLTNEKAQKTIFKTVAKTTEMFQAGMEEMKERFEDAKAEMEAEKQ